MANVIFPVTTYFMDFTFIFFIIFSSFVFVPIYHRWFKKPMHTDPTDAVQIHQDVLAKKSVGIHWGTFRLGNEVYATA